MSFGRVIAYVVMSATQAVAKAFTLALREGAKNAKEGAPAAKNAASAAAAGVSKRSGMALEEAQKVLNITESASYADIQKNYQHLFLANEKAKGSFYLQSKVYRAGQTLEDAWTDKFEGQVPLDESVKEAVEELKKQLAEAEEAERLKKEELQKKREEQSKNKDK
eukprot:m.11055 g.11055  ORF g.11055 m.11055 type:complete len:165 (-) comp5663_c0_seq1:789-1283(-)